jgi:hypothetical protein
MWHDPFSSVLDLDDSLMDDQDEKCETDNNENNSNNTKKSEIAELKVRIIYMLPSTSMSILK